MTHHSFPTACYDSKLLPKAPGLGTRDPLREAMDEARLAKLPIIAYCVVQQGGHFLKAHPEWEMRGADGKPIGRFCYNSGYLEAMKAIVAEQLAYGIDGFHIDMVDQGFGPPHGCWCDVCQREFQKQFSRSMPKGATWDDAWDQMLEFRYATSERFEKTLCAHIKSINPRATVDYNYHGNPPFSFEVGQRPVQHAGNSDFITGETGVWGFSALTVGLNAEFYRAAVPHQRVQVAMQRGVRMYHDQTTRPLNDIRWELLTLLAHGSFVTVVDKTGFDGWLDPVTYDRIGAAFQEARAKRAHFGHRPVAEVGIFFSSRARDWVGRARPADYFQSFQGAHKALVYEHLDFAIVTASYHDRALGRGADYARAPITSVGLHGKLWYHDNDTVSLRYDEMNRASQDRATVERYRKELGVTETAQETIWQYRRGTGFVLGNGIYQSFFDLHGGYFDDLALMAEVKRLNQVFDESKQHDCSSVAEILVVSDEPSCSYATFESGFLQQTLQPAQVQLAKLGAPHDSILVDDLARAEMKRYQFVIFLNCFHLTDGQRELIRRTVLKRKRTVKIRRPLRSATSKAAMKLPWR